MPITIKLSRRQFVATAASTAALAALPAVAIAQHATQHAQGEPMTLTPYLLFDGNCHEAMHFYQSCFGGDLQVTRVKDSPARDQMPAFQHEKTLNARLVSSNLEISASDWLRLDRTRVPGNTACLFLSGGSPQQTASLFARLSEGGDVTDPLKTMFFGTYGALNDRFGVRWMFHAAAQ